MAPAQPIPPFAALAQLRALFPTAELKTEATPEPTALALLTPSAAAGLAPYSLAIPAIVPPTILPIPFLPPIPAEVANLSAMVFASSKNVQHKKHTAATLIDASPQTARAGTSGFASSLTPVTKAI